MAWLSRVNFVSSDTLSFTDINNLGNDIRAWGDNVNGGGYTLSNVILSASSGTMALVSGGTTASSVLTLQSTSGVGTSDAIVFRTGSQLERMRLTSAGNVGIGTVNPGAKLDVRSGMVRLSTDGSPASAHGINRGDTSSVNGMCSINMFGSGAFGYLGNITFLTSGADVFNATLVERVRIDPNGNVGIGTAAPTSQLQLSLDSASKPSTNTWTIASDARLKTVRGEYEKGLAEICALRPVRYEYNGKGGFAADGAEHVSILAQEAQKVFPECVNTFRGKLEKDGEEVDLLNYNGHAITFALINAVKELKAMIEAKK